MPEIRLTEEQLERLESVSDELETAYVGPYGRVTPADAVDYLLDTYTPPSDHGDTSAEGEATGAVAAATDEADAGADADDAATTNGNGTTDADDEATSKPGGDSPLAAVAALLEDNDDVWRKSGGDAPYEVDLPDGSTEGVRTKDDVKRLLFKHYR